jgi:hypothetical protein
LHCVASKFAGAIHIPGGSSPSAIMPAASLTRKRRSSAEAISGGVGGERRLMRLAAMRDPGESYSDVILRLATAD